MAQTMDNVCRPFGGGIHLRPKAVNAIVGVVEAGLDAIVGASPCQDFSISTNPVFSNR